MVNIPMAKSRTSGGNSVTEKYDQKSVNLPGKANESNQGGCNINTWQGDAVVNTNRFQVHVDHETGLATISERKITSSDKLETVMTIDLKTGQATDKYGVVYDMSKGADWEFDDGTHVALPPLPTGGDPSRDLLVWNLQGDGDKNGNFGAVIPYAGDGAELEAFGGNADGREISKRYVAPILNQHLNNMPTEDIDGDGFDRDHDAFDPYDLSDKQDDDDVYPAPVIHVKSVFTNEPPEGFEGSEKYFNEKGEFNYDQYRKDKYGMVQSDNDNKKGYGTAEAVKDDKAGAWTIQWGYDDEDMFGGLDDKLWCPAFAAYDLATAPQANGGKPEIVRGKMPTEQPIPRGGEDAPEFGGKENRDAILAATNGSSSGTSNSSSYPPPSFGIFGIASTERDSNPDDLSGRRVERYEHRQSLTTA